MTWTAALAAPYLLGFALAAPSPTPCAPPTGLGATIIVPSSPAATLPEGASPTDVVIEVHTAKAGCVGTGRWSGSAVAISLWADDPTTEPVEGFVDGEPAELVVVDVETGAVFRDGNVEVAYEDGFDITKGLEIDRVYIVSDADGGPEGTPDGMVAVGEREGWALLAAAGTGADFLSPLWTQGYPGADDEAGPASVYRYGPSAEFEPMASSAADLPAGVGVMTYLFEDDDPETHGVDGFPKVLPGPAEPAFPFAFPIAGASPDGGWHLLGNPSQDVLDWDADGWDRSGVSRTVYVYDGARYRSWNGRAGSLGSGEIAPGQGFWVRSTSEGPSLSAPGSARQGSDTPDAGETEPDAGAGVVRLELEGTGGARNALSLMLEPDGEFAFDALDALALQTAEDAGPRLVAWTDGEDPLALEVASFPLAGADGGGTWEAGLDVLSATKADGLTVSWSSASVPEGWSLELTDTVTGTTLDLAAPGSYRLDAPANMREDEAPDALAPPPAPSEIRPSDLSPAPDGPRFVLRAADDRVLTVPTEEASETRLYSPAPNPVRSTTAFSYELGAPGPARLSLFDTLGREVAVVHDVAHADGLQRVRFDASRLSAGVYVLRLESEGSPVAAPMTVVR